MTDSVEDYVRVLEDRQLVNVGFLHPDVPL